jgi:hypothetical protein
LINEAADYLFVAFKLGFDYSVKNHIDWQLIPRKLIKNFNSLSPKNGDDQVNARKENKI